MTNEIMRPGPAPIRRMFPALSTVPAAAVPITVKIPAPTTEPMPNATKSHLERIRFSLTFASRLSFRRVSVSFVAQNPLNIFIVYLFDIVNTHKSDRDKVVYSNNDLIQHCQEINFY